MGIHKQVNDNSLVLSKPKLITALIVGLLLTANAFPQTAQQRHEQLLTAINSGNRSAALAELRKIRADSPEVFLANNYDYLLARLSEDSGDIAESQGNYQTIVKRTSLLAGYALWHLAQRARNTGDLILERERLRQFLAIQSNELLRSAALLRLGESFMESNDYSSVVASLQPLMANANGQVSRKAQLLSAEALQKDNKSTEARELFNRILMKMPDASRPDDFALEAVAALDDLEGNPQVSKVTLTEADHLLRASVYQFNRHFDQARSHYLTVIQTQPQSPTVPNALYQVGRGLYQQQHYEQAIDYFRRVSTQWENDSARDALAFTAASFNRLQRTDEAIATYRQFISRYPDAPNPERAYLNLIDALHEAGRYPEALNWVSQTRARFANQLPGALALFAQLRIHLAQGQWSAVVADADELKKASDLGGARVASGSSSAEVLFLKAFALEQLGRFDEAVDAYLSLPDGRNEYFGQRATERLRALNGKPNAKPTLESRLNQFRLQATQASTSGQFDVARRAAQSGIRLAEGRQREELLGVIKLAYQSLPAYTFPNLSVISIASRQVYSDQQQVEATPSSIAAELIFLGLYDEGVPAFVAARPATVTTNQGQQAAQPTDADYTLAVFGLRGGLGNIAVRFGERLWRNIPADYVLEVAPREYVDLLYPAPHRSSLLAHASSRGVDPRFVLAIARQESRFQADAKSVAAARGMMQFISETANQTATQLGEKEFQQDELYNPDTAILFGAQYLAVLFKQFPGQPEAVAGSYNGGAENLARWIARSHSDVADRYVSEIGFAQTKDYVFRVMTNYRAYQQLYDSNLQGH